MDQGKFCERWYPADYEVHVYTINADKIIYCLTENTQYIPYQARRISVVCKNKIRSRVQKFPAWHTKVLPITGHEGPEGE